MKVFKLDGVDIYVVAFSRKEAVILCLLERIGIIEENLIETTITVDREAIGQVFRSYEELSSYIE